MAKISDEKATILLRECYEKYFIESSHFIIRSKLENENYVYYDMIDERLGKDFSRSYFNGQTMGLRERFIYNVAQEKFIEFNVWLLEDYFSKKDMRRWNRKGSIREQILYDRMIESTPFMDIYEKIGREAINKKAGIPSFLPWYTPSFDSKNNRFLKLKYEHIGLEEISDEYKKVILEKIIEQLKEYKINYYYENDVLYIDRKIPDDF